MSKAAEFDKLASEFKAVLAGQDMLKDEVIQLVTERMMFFVVGNMDLMARALRLVAMVSLGAEEDPDVLDRLTIMCRKEKGGRYVVILTPDVCVLEESREPAYGYLAQSTSKIHVRRQSEMEDGRFSIICSAEING